MHPERMQRFGSDHIEEGSCVAYRPTHIQAVVDIATTRLSCQLRQKKLTQFLLSEILCQNLIGFWIRNQSACGHQ